MESSFDPYRKWLGILPADQPPHHYRLLGVEPFESDPDVIANAADARMAHVKTFQVGKHSALSQQLLNEIAAAKVCLLQGEKKAQYDRALQRRLEAKEQAARAALPKAVPVSLASSSSADPHTGGVIETPVPSFSTRPASSYMAARKRRSWQTPVAILIAVALLVGGLIFLMTRNGALPVVGQRELPGQGEIGPPRENLSPPAPEREKPVRSPTDEHDQSSEGEVPAGEGAPAEGEKPADTGRLEDSGVIDPPEPVVRETPTDTAGPEAGGPLPGVADAQKKLPVPDDAEQQAAEQEIRAIYRSQFAAANAPAEKLALADRLFKEGIDTIDNPAARFVLFRLACELSGGAGNLDTTLGVIDRIAERYDVDACGMKADVLAQTIESIRTGTPTVADSRQIVQTAMALIDEAVAGDDYATAGRVSRLALPAARKAKDLRLINDLQAREREIDRARQRFGEIRKHLDRLKEDPADGEANLEVGRWYCFVKGRWEEGLGHLARGADAALADLARRDLALPGEPGEQAKLGDGWREMAEKEKGSSGTAVLSRAAHWYRQALPGVSGLTEAGIRKKLDEIVAEEVPTGSRIRGLVQPGNVALASNGTTVTGVANNPACLFDGNSTRYARNGDGLAYSPFPCEWTITLGKVYQLQEIRFKLYDLTPRYYQYAMASSPDGENYTPLVDRRQGQWFGWQRIRFPPRRVKTIKLIGLYNSAVSVFNVVELEAYCVPPAAPPR